MNHIASFAGDDDRRDINATLLQPFAARKIGPARTVSANFESTYDWERSRWNAPLNVAISQVLKIREQVISVQLGGAYYVEAPDGAAEWGARSTLTFLFPKR